MPTSTASARTPSSLEKDLGLLLAALDKNNNEEWEGKPRQERFRVYEPLNSSSPQPQPQSQPQSQQQQRRDESLPTASPPSKTENSQPTSALLDAQNSVAAAASVESQQAKKSQSEAARSSLDALMGAYVAALRGLRKAGACTDPRVACLPNHSETAPEAEDMAHLEQFSNDAAVSTNAPLNTSDACVSLGEDADLQSLLNALDRLPALSKP